ncbi:MAG: hypothetical protein LBT74_05795 [Acidobacteriota bacterium]|jgi:hypothetical protein|nr:hypothetical protein [Acidobacteriota bacterium]
MKKATALLCILCSLFCVSACNRAKQAAQEAKDLVLPDREPLVKLMDQYLDAVVRHDPAGLPLAEDVKLVENITPTPVGEGLWKTATSGPTEFKIYTSDPTGGQVGFMGVIGDGGKPALLGARLKVVDGKITEIDHMVSPIDGEVPEGLLKPREGLVTKLAVGEHASREEMLKAANAYYDAIEFSDGDIAPFADDCMRRENGVTSAGNTAPPPPDEGETPFGAMAAFGRLKCGEQLSTGIMGYITKINQRRLFAVDEEMGLVMAYSVFNHDGEPNPLPIKNMPGVTESPNSWGKFTVPAAHIYKIKDGKIHEIEAMAIVNVNGKPIPYQASDGWNNTRQDLVNLMDGYLAALAKHDPSAVPLAADAKIVENGEAIKTDAGLWKTATSGPTKFKIVTADPNRGEVGFMGVIGENGKPTLAAVRLKVADDRRVDMGGKIVEVDHLVVHGDQPLNPNMAAPRPAFLARDLKLERVHRDKMAEIADSYYEAILKDDGTVAPFADDCQRRENGGITAGNPKPDPKSDFAVFEKMKCGEQLSTNVMSYITDINDRRIFAIDEELGLVMAFSVFRHDGEPKVMTIKNVPGVTERKNDYGPFELPAAHVFKIRNGQMHEIEAIGYIYTDKDGKWITGFKNGW